ncbi:IPT/TIG domain-containing protein [Paenibacillus sp. NPDC057967]|uniref:IPT/TIG domain-containing protein n=1 Tax=Paenibacillus sp. NPDC057967 TaxID=3346293 RepID=UPI0036DE9B62
MSKVKQNMLLLFMLWFAVSGVFLGPKQATASLMDYVTVTKTANPTKISTLEETEITLNITGTPPVNVVMPNDVVLVIDKSGSMAPGYNNGEDKMTNAKEAAKGFVDLMDLSKHRVAVVDFSGSNMIDSLDFTTDKTTAKSYIDTIQANGSTATGDAIDTARALLANHRPEAQPVIVIMTDGDATQPSNDPYGYAKQKAMQAKEEGIIFYTIALLKATDDPATSGPNVLLKEMATTANHHHFVLGSTGLSEIYAAIVREIGLASAYNVAVSDVVGSNFEIVPGSYDHNIPKPTVTGNTLTWTFNELKNNTLSFTYKIRPVDATVTGKFPVSLNTSSITYLDYAGASRVKSIPSVNVDVRFPAPTITSITEPSGHPDGGETVTIQGEYFLPGAGVTFGGKQASQVTVVSNNEITAVTPSGKQGTVEVRVTNPDSQYASIPYQYKTNPVITTFTPNSGPVAGGDIVIVEGNFLVKGLSIKFGDVPATISSHTGLSYIVLNTPPTTTAGPVDVTFTNPDGTSTTLADGYTYIEPVQPEPVVLSVTPNSGIITGGEQVFVNGKNFNKNLKVLVGSKEAATTFQSKTQLSIIVPPGDALGLTSVSVRDAEGELYVLPDAYTYNPIVYPEPTLSSISPNSGLIAGGEIVYLSGKKFVRNVTKVFIGDKEAEIIQFNASQLTVSVPAGEAAGKVDVKVVTDIHEATLPQAYEYKLPVIPVLEVTSISPNRGLTTGGELVNITGNNFVRNATVTFGNQTVSTTFWSKTLITAVVPAVSTTGTVDVIVTNPDGATDVIENGYEYIAVTPTITSLSPARGNKTGGEVIYVSGTNFDRSAVVSINGIAATTVYLSKSSLQVTVPASPVTGEVQLVVTLGTGTSASAAFVYDNGPQLPAPTIKNLSQATGKAGDFVYITGTNFNKSSIISINSVPVTEQYYYTAKSLAFVLPAGYSGPVVVTVTNPDGQVSNEVIITYN